MKIKMLCKSLRSHAQMLCVAAIGMAAGVANAQSCYTGWRSGPIPYKTGANGPVYAMHVWTPPGNLPLLIVGGAFTEIGGIAANNIASFDGINWRALGNGTDGAVHALTSYNSQLMVGGAFLAPGIRLAAWNGSTWAPFASMGDAVADPSIAVRVMTVFNGQLYVGGRFCCVNGVGVPENCARFDGSLWYAAPGISNVVRTMQVADWDEGGPEPPVLFIGGQRYPNGTGGATLRSTTNGITWTDISGPIGDVYAMTFGPPVGIPLVPTLYVAGGYASWYTGSTFIQVNGIARYTQFGVFDVGAGFEGGTARTMVFNGADLYLGGYFDGGGTLTSPNAMRIVRGGPGTWATMGSGIDEGENGWGVWTMCVYNGLLIVGGDFISATDSLGLVPAENIVQWHGASWQNFPQAHVVHAMTAIGSRLVVGGRFSQATQASASAPIVNRANIMTWDGQHTSGMGGGTNGEIRALTSYTISGPSGSTNVIAGGDFTTVYGDGLNPLAPIAANRVAQWSESALGLTGWSAMGAGFNNSVQALERFNGEIVAGGFFTMSGATSTPRLARWTGNPASWQPFGAASFNGPVYALKSFSTNLGANQHLVIGGSFTSASGTGQTASRILQISQSTSGSSWVGLGAGFNGTVHAIERYRVPGTPISAESTYAGGVFTASGTTQLNRIARWNGSAWVAVGNGIGFNGVVTALRSAGGYLYAAGSFTSVDGIAANRVARWNGTAWSAVDVGVDATAYALAAYQNEVAVGGSFIWAGGTPVPVVSPRFARVLQSGIPWIARQPTGLSRACGQTAEFHVAVADGYPAVTYQWRKGGVPLTDGPRFSGSQTASLTISALVSADAGVYDCDIINTCGTANSLDATLTISTCCPADINSDGLVNVSDLLAVIAAWGSTRPTPADVNGDSVVNVTDLLAVIAAWGPCP